MGAFKKLFLLFLMVMLVGVSLFLLWVSNHYVVPIMMYHHVAPTTEPQANWVDPRTFEEHMAFIKDKAFRPLSLDQLINAIREGKEVPRKSVVVTFDDGNEDNYRYAYPILKKHNIPAIFFVSSQLIGAEGYMTWDQLREMHENGFTIASHGRTHAYLPDLHEEDMREEILLSKEEIAEQIAVPVEYFAYPVGGFNEEIKAVLLEGGYQGAVATNRGYDRMNRDVYELNRIRFSDSDDNPIDLWAKLSGYYNLFRALKPPQ